MPSAVSSPSQEVYNRDLMIHLDLGLAKKLELLEKHCHRAFKMNVFLFTICDMIFIKYSH
jgi:hypothetical protein